MFSSPHRSVIVLSGNMSYRDDGDDHLSVEESKLAHDDQYRSYGNENDDGNPVAYRSLGSGPMMMDVQPVAPMMDLWNNQQMPSLGAPGLSSKGTSWDAPGLKSKQLDAGIGEFVMPSLSTEILAIEQPGPLKPTPAFFTRQTSFISTSSADKLLADVDAALTADTNVDHELKHAQNKVKGFCRGGEGRAGFTVKVYDNGDNEILIEFHRVSGCCVTFNKFYKQSISCLEKHFARRAISPKGATEKLSEVLPPPKPDFFSMPLPPLDPEGAEACLEMPNLVEGLCSDVVGDFVDLQQTALCALSTLSASASEAVPPKCLIPALKKGLGSSDGLGREYATSFLVNVCSQEQFRGPVLDELMSELFSVLDSPGSLENRASKRHVAKAFALLSSSPQHANSMKERMCPQFSQTLERFSGCADVPLRQHIQSTLAQISAV
jgi:hypothetical protein